MKWNDGTARRWMQFGFYLAALGISAFFLFFARDEFNPTWAGLVIVFCLYAGFAVGIPGTDRSTRADRQAGGGPGDKEDQGRTLSRAERHALEVYERIRRLAADDPSDHMGPDPPTDGRGRRLRRRGLGWLQVAA